MEKLDQQLLIDTITERIEQLQNLLACKQLKTAGDEQLEISKLTRSLLWLNSDQAGKCMECGATIPMAQLKAIPTSQMCADCTQKQ